jgi:hypothetical protein
VEDRRNDFASPAVVRPFIDRLIQLGTLPEPTDYYVRWPEIKNLNDAQRMLLATGAADLNAKAGETIVTPSEIRDKILGLEPLSPEQIKEEQAKAMAKADAAAKQFGFPKRPGARPGDVGAAPKADGEPPPKEPTTANALSLSLAAALEADNFILAQDLLVEALSAE